MRLTEILDVSCVRVPMKATDKKAAIEELVDVLAATGLVQDKDELRRVVLEREATRTTGIGYGLAIPHGKCASCKRLVMAVGKPAQPIDFESVDGQPVSIVVLLASPLDQTGPHIQALARISRLMLDEEFRQQLEKAETPEELFDAIAARDGATAET